MNRKTVLMATNLSVWSMANNKGASSFYKTLKLYNDKGLNIILFSTEAQLNLPELKLVRCVKVPKLKNINKRYLYTVSRIFNYLISNIIFLFIFLKKNLKVDIFYGYEIEFIPALKLLSIIKNKPIISRFQGTILFPLLTNKLWWIKYFPHYFSLRLKTDLTIMTNDGTNGDDVIMRIRGNSLNVLFLRNGLDFYSITENEISNKVKALSQSTNDYTFNFISVSRIEHWKRLDRSIDVFQKFYERFPNSRYLIVGEGEELAHLKKYAIQKKLDKNVLFVGAVSNREANYLMGSSNIFLSHYQLSNLGNPLWEAIYNKCLIVTIANGATGKVIKDGINGIISNEDIYVENAEKLIEIIEKRKESQLMQAALDALKNEICSWKERMEYEFQFVIGFVNK